MFARSDRGAEDIGNWTINEGLYCSQYQRLNGGRQTCFWLAREGQELRVHRSEDERLVGVAEVLQGDARHLGQ